MNSIFVIRPYRVGSFGWSFDDESRGITNEPFVAGMPEIIDTIISEQTDPRIVKRFRATFSGDEFPGHSHRLAALREEYGGCWYRLTRMGSPLDGWLCPVLYQFFGKPPRSIYLSFNDFEMKK